MQWLKGKRTVIVNAVVAIGGIVGAVIEPDQVDAIVGGVLAAVGVVNILLRAVTDTPIGRKE